MLHMWLAKLYHSPRLSSMASLRRIWERNINNKLNPSCIWQPDFHGWVGKSLPIADQPGGIGPWDSHISSCTHHTWKFECGGGDRRTSVWKALHRGFGLCVLHFRCGPEPVFEPKLTFSPHFVELSLQGLLLNVRIRNLHHCWSLSQEMPWMGWPRTLLLSCLPWQGAKILPIYVTTRDSVTCGQQEGGMLAEQCWFLLPKYRWQIEFGSKQLKMVLSLACSFPWHHNGHHSLCGHG